MRSVLTTRVRRIASHVEKRATPFPLMICKSYDRTDEDIIGLRMGISRVPRQPSETIEPLLTRARSETGCGMWAADYRELIVGMVGETEAACTSATPIGC